MHFERGAVQTPAFMPVATYATVVMTTAELRGWRELFVSNTFHLWLRPGTEVIESHGSLHGFMNWDVQSSPIRAVSKYSVWERCARSPKKGLRFVRPKMAQSVFGSGDFDACAAVTGLGRGDGV